jgi:hydroxyethylthiazole kinase-like uncharacterized protein yjeF
MRIVSAETMQALDRRTITELGLPALVLMERAALGVLTALRTHFSHQLEHVHILAGRGNNGGDGLALARMLQGQGFPVEVWMTGATETASPDQRLQAQMLDKLGIVCHELAEHPDWRSHIARASLVVDAIFGVGLNRPISGIWAEVINWLNQLPVPVVAIDIPSGIHANTGMPLGEMALYADMTVTCGLPKWGLLMDPALPFVGQLEMVDIGIPPSYSATVTGGHLLDAALARSLTPPPRRPDAHKGRFGRLLIIAGSLGMSGAAVMSAQAALKAGAGVVTLAVPAAIQTQVAQQIPQALVFALPDHAGFLSIQALPALLQHLERANVVMMGPGLGLASETQDLLRELLPAIRIPLLLDADGLNHLAALSVKPEAPLLITPHPGELGRLLGHSVATIQADRLRFLHEGAARFDCIHVLKGARTLIGTPDGRCWVNSSGNPALARGGSGDLLAGLMAGLISQGHPLEAAALLGVYWHGLAADLVVQTLPETCVTLVDLLETLPAALKQLQISARGA